MSDKKYVHKYWSRRNAPYSFDKNIVVLEEKVYYSIQTSIPWDDFIQSIGKTGMANIIHESTTEVK